MSFTPFRAVLLEFILIRTAGEGAADWLAATVDPPQPDGGPVLERLTERAFLEILRRQIHAPTPHGWPAAILDPALSRGLLAVHANPRRDWTLPDIAQESGLSRSALVSRFAACLGTSPMRNLRDWRLYFAAQELAATARAIIAIVTDAGYSTEAAFTRAFSRNFGQPPAEWRRTRSRSAA